MSTPHECEHVQRGHARMPMDTSQRERTQGGAPSLCFFFFFFYLLLLLRHYLPATDDHEHPVTARAHSRACPTRTQSRHGHERVQTRTTQSHTSANECNRV